ncbi:poly(A)-specific ribonuclease, partial [Coemansia sp. IMI 209127]
MAMDGGSDWTEYTQTWNAQAGEVWPVFSAAFAADSELLYTGDGSGRLTTYTLGGAGEALERQTSFQCAHTPLSRLFALRSNHVLAQSSDTLQLRTAGGRRIFGKTTTPNDPFTAAALNISTYSDVLVCTSAGTASLLDLSRGAVVKRINLESSTVALDLDRAALTSGTAAGYLAVRDPRANFNLVHSASVFSGPVSDIVTTGKFIYACGAKAGAGNAYHMARDNMVRVYDRRNMSACLDAIDCEDSGTPAKLSINGNDLWICHDSGYADARVLDNHDHSSAFIEPELGEYAYASAFCLSPSGSAALVADTDGVLHLWANQESPQLSVCGKDPDLHCSNAQHTWNVRGSGLRIDDEHISLSVVPLPQIKEPLLSRMDNDVLCDVGRPVTFVDPEIIGHLKKIDSVEYAPNPRNYTRNQQAFGPQWRAKWKDGADAFKDDAELTQGRSKFLSVQRHRGEQQLQPPAVASSGILNEGRVSSIDTNASRGSPSVQQQVQQQVGATRFPIDMVSGGKIPKQMQRMRIEYSRFGVEDFDFSLYNSTQWSGLEGNITNSYANSLLQMLFFTAEFRSLVMSHCATDCPATKCLSCQMGLLFRMLQTANGTSCQAVQLLNILADRSEATALALLEDAHGNLADGATYSIVAQRLLRFFLEQANNECAPLSDGLRHKGQQRFVEQIIGFPQETKTICPACRHTQVRTSHAFSVDLDSPQG